MPTFHALPSPAVVWGTLARGDAGDARRTRGLGLGAAVRRYNDLAVPGIGGLWFAKPLVWSMIGISLGGKSATRAEIANAVEVVAMLHALRATGGDRNPRINGRTKLAGHVKRATPFSSARKRAFYVTVPFRQGMVQPLRELGLAASSIQRFNAFVPTKAGTAFLRAAVEPFRPYNRELLDVVREWVGEGRPDLMDSGKMGDALTPLTGLPGPAAELLREQLFGGPSAKPRTRVRDWLRVAKRAGSQVMWDAPPAGFDTEHWFDLRDGARFFVMRDEALRTLDAVEMLLRSAAHSEATLAEATKAAAGELEALRAAATTFLSGGRHERAPGALHFARSVAQTDQSAVLSFLAARDGRGVRATPGGVAAGSAFNPHGPRGDDENDTDAIEGEESEASSPAQPQLRLPAGSSGRLTALSTLDEDIEASCATTTVNARG